MLHWIRRSVRNKLMLLVLATTFTALLVAALAMAIYEVRTYQKSWVDDVTTQANLLARASAAALTFDDPRAAQENLALLRVRPKIVAGAIYTPAGNLFAQYQRGTGGSADRPFPAQPRADGFRIEGERLEVFQRIVENNEILGTVYLSAEYELVDRLRGYLSILVGVLAASLLVAFLVSLWLQSSVTAPIGALTQAVHGVMERRDYAQRVQKTTEDEIGGLVDAFNAMLAELGQRSAALEASMRDLQHEMHERRGAEEALRAADRRKDEFLATLAHELRNPMAPLRNALQVLRVAGADSNVARQAREIMERQLVQMVRLVDDLLDVSRITTGKLALRPERVSLAGIMRNALDTVAPMMSARQHQLVVEEPEQDVMLEADPTRLAQVFANLLNNAAKYTDPGGVIRFTAALGGAMAPAGGSRRQDPTSAAGRDLAPLTDAGYVTVRVADNGIGIAPEMLGQVFEMFTQADYSLERSHAGLGVGLTLARRLVELHGGSITVHSAGLGQGSTFEVCLPLPGSV